MKILKILFILSISTNYGQTVLISDFTPDDFSNIDGNFGPNRKYYIYNYLGGGIKSSLVKKLNEDFISLKLGSELNFGTRYRIGFGRVFAIIYDLQLNSSWNKINLKENPVIPISVINLKKVSYIYHQIGNSISTQFNFNPKRGNRLGTYLDLGVFGSYIYSNKFRYKLELADLSDNTVVTIKKMEYFNKFIYGLIGRIGKEKFIFYGKFRLSDLFNNETSFTSPELPRFTLGMELLISHSSHQ